MNVQKHTFMKWINYTDFCPYSCIPSYSISFSLSELEGPCPNHIHVMCNGHIFKMIPFDQQGELLTAPELYR